MKSEDPLHIRAGTGAGKRIEQGDEARAKMIEAISGLS
jgi:hypothetical protein